MFLKYKEMNHRIENFLRIISVMILAFQIVYKCQNSQTKIQLYVENNEIDKKKTFYKIFYWLLLSFHCSEIYT